MKSVKILALCLFVLLHAISRAGEFTPKSLSDTLKEYDRGPRPGPFGENSSKNREEKG